MKNNNFENYTTFIKNLDDFCSKIYSHYKKNINCKNGCSKCCISDLTILPVEADYIKSKTDLEKITPNKDKYGCVFLKDGSCQIYESRPIVCRTQGYPLLYKDDESDNAEMSYCDLNFKNIEDGFTFSGEFIIQMNKINTILYALDLDYLKNINKTELKSKRCSMKEIISSNK